MSNSPQPGWTTRCRIERVVDGDTLDVTVIRKIRVRLLECWAPEKTQPAGRESLEAIKQHEGEEAILFIPTESDTLDEIMTFGRVLGHVWLTGDDRSLSERQVEQGHATKEKVK